MDRRELIMKLIMLALLPKEMIRSKTRKDCTISAVGDIDLSHKFIVWFLLNPADYEVGGTRFKFRRNIKPKSKILIFNQSCVSRHTFRGFLSIKLGER